MGVASLRHFPAGKTIYTLGEDSRDLWYVLKGSLRLNIATHEHEPRFGHIIGPGFCFGEFELITGGPRLIEFRTLEPAEMLFIRQADFERIAEERPELWRWLAALSAQHTLLALGAADDLMLRSIQGRAAAILLRLSSRRGGHPSSSPVDRLFVTQQDLADAFNMSLSATGRIIRDFSRLGLITTGYGDVRILDADGLGRLVRSGSTFA